MFIVLVSGAKYLPYGTLLKVKELDGFRLPSGQKHNGCIRVEGICESCKNDCTEIVLHLRYFEDVVAANWPYSVTVSEQDCEVLEY